MRKRLENCLIYDIPLLRVSSDVRLVRETISATLAEMAEPAWLPWQHAITAKAADTENASLLACRKMVSSDWLFHNL